MSFSKTCFLTITTCLLCQTYATFAFTILESRTTLSNSKAIGGSTLESSTSRSTSTRLYQTPSFPSYDELNQQKSEALRSLSSSHDGTWICSNGAISFSTTSDLSAGMTNKKRSPPYETTVSTRLGYSSNGDTLKLVEALSWEQGDKDRNEKEEEVEEEKTISNNNDSMNGNTFFARQCPLGASMDIDSVDGSYSLHSHPTTRTSDNTNGVNSDDEEYQKSSCALPQAISGVDGQLISSIIEHCLVLNDNERTRCFLLYGKNGIYGQSNDDEGLEERLIRVVISHEHRQVENNNGEGMLQMIEEASRPPIVDDNRLAQLSSVMGEQFGGGDDDAMKKYPISMMTLSLGPWLGDLVVRDRSFNDALPKSRGKQTGKGFGVSKMQSSEKKNKKEASSGFAEFVIGVQKVAMQFDWDYGSKVKHSFEFGKSMGCYCEGWPSVTLGTISEERMSRRLKPEDRTMYIDYDMGTYCGFIVGSVYINVSVLSLRYAIFSIYLYSFIT